MNFIKKCANAEIHSLVDEVKDELLGKLGRNAFEPYKAVTYRSQVTAGRDYFVKVQVGPDEYIHVRLLEPLQRNTDGTSKRVSLTSYQEGKKAEDDVVYF